MNRRTFSLLAVLACCLALTSCAARQPLPPADPGQVWSGFLARQRTLEGQSPHLMVRASLWYTTPERSNRTVVALWGSLERPLRADINASMGAAIGLFREDAAGWIAYYPQSKEAVSHAGGGAGAGALGVNVPFSLRDVGLLLTGRLLPLTGEEPRSSMALANGDTAILLAEGATAERLVLDREGRPVELTGGDGEPWTVTVKDYDELAPGLATVVEMTLSGNRSARLIIKSLELRETPWPEAATALDIPPQVPVRAAHP